MKKYGAISVAVLAMSTLATFASATSASASDPSGVLVNAQTGKCIAPYQGKTANGTWLVQYKCNVSSSLQQWINIDEGNGMHHLYNVGAKRCATIYDASFQAGTYTTLWDCSSDAEAAQDFVWQQEGEIVAESEPPIPHLVLTVDGGSTADDAHITVWPYSSGNSFQIWRFV